MCALFIARIAADIYLVANFSISVEIYSRHSFFVVVICVAFSLQHCYFAKYRYRMLAFIYMREFLRLVRISILL